MGNSSLNYKRFDQKTIDQINQTKNLDSLDLLGLLHLWSDNWDNIASEKGHSDEYTNQFRDCIHATKTIRHNYLGHLNFTEKSRWTFLRVFDTLHRIAVEVEANSKIISQARKNRDSQLRLISEGLEECWILESEKIKLESCDVIIEEIKKAGWEKDVLSVPVATSFHLVDKFKIHSTPKKPKYQYKKTRYITFRNPKWEMHNLYEVSKIIRVEFSNEKDLSQLFRHGFAKKQKSLSENELDRLRQYCKTINFIENEIIYILSEPCISLPHCPKPQKEMLPPLYFSLEELKNGKTIVFPDID